jgi:hypothetical protein
MHLRRSQRSPNSLRLEVRVSARNRRVPRSPQVIQDPMLFLNYCFASTGCAVAMRFRLKNPVENAFV